MSKVIYSSRVASLLVNLNVLGNMSHNPKGKQELALAIFAKYPHNLINDAMLLQDGNVKRGALFIKQTFGV